MAEKIVVESRVREFVKSVDEEMRVSGDLLDTLNATVEQVLSKAIHRTKLNGRKTVSPQDL